MAKRFFSVKRLAAIAASVVLAASTFTSAVFAEPSKTDYVEVISAVDADGNDPHIIVWPEEDLNGEGLADSELRIMTQEEADATVPFKDKAHMKSTILAQPVITAEDGVKFPVKLTFAVPGIKEGEDVVMYECIFASDAGFAPLQQPMVRGAMGIKITTKSSATWKALPTKVMDGKIEVTFEHIQDAPRATYPIVLHTDVNAGGSGDDDTPKTGDINWAMPAAIIAVVAAAGIVVIVLTGRRRKAK